MNTPKYIIGIDLGTTNSTLAYLELGKQNPVIEQLFIPQVTIAGTQGENLALPSFLYFPLAEELKSKSAAVTWDPKGKYCIGMFARDRGAEIPSRMISSAKSWLCHTGIDRRSKILPHIADDDDLEKTSPLEACSAILKHLLEAWHQKFPTAPFHEQQILITVPASFDPSARQLVLEATQMAGYPEVVLLEEPQAAFYAWLYAHESTWRKILKVDDVILIVDIGGGTTDFSLISVKEEQGELSLQRQAVGTHLLLGGDNIDLSLAYVAKGKLEEKGHNIDDKQLQALVHACRQGKEKLMSSLPADSVDITIMGRGSKLIGGSIKTVLTAKEVVPLIVDGFMPQVPPQERSPLERRSGLQAIGLPYAQDARITCQLAKFLSMTGDADSQTMDHFVMPTAVLFNGGTMKADVLRNQLIDVLNSWAAQVGKQPIKLLPDPDYDMAVSKGAAYYGLARAGHKIRIRSGTSRSYFIGVEEAAPAVPGMPTPMKAICVVPFGMEEGTEQELSAQEFALVLGEQASFRFFSNTAPKLMNGTEPVMGTTVKNWKHELLELHPIETVLSKSEGDGKTINVKIKSRVTELGVLEIWCVGPDGRKWKLEFDIRDHK